MIRAIPTDQITSYGLDFPGARPGMVLASIDEGNADAHLWLALDERKRRTALLWDKGNNIFYVSGDAPSEATADELAALVAVQVRRRAIAEGRIHFRARALAPSLERLVPHLFHPIPLCSVTKRFYQFKTLQSPEVYTPVFDGLSFVPIDRELLARGELENLAAVRREIRWMWPGEERFFERGFGCAALARDAIICWCTAEYVSGRMCGIGVETVEAFQGRGVATATAARFVAECLARGIQPAWECDARNVPSIRVAEKVGFTFAEEQSFWAGVFTGHDT